jgi:hypothetical protein
MNRLVALFTGFHVLIHSIFGCCDQAFAKVLPAVLDCHCDTGHSHQAHSERVAYTPCADHFELGGAGDCNDRSSPLQSHSCRHASCHWLTASHASVELFIVSHFLSSLDLPLVERMSGKAAALPAAIESLQNRALPLRLHLAVGVLLI